MLKDQAVPFSAFEKYIENDPSYLSLEIIDVDFLNFMTVARYPWGYAIETEHTDEDDLVTKEFLISIDGILAQIVDRLRYGGEHSEMKTYQRDSKYPVGCFVNLVPQCS